MSIPVDLTICNDKWNVCCGFYGQRVRCEGKISYIVYTREKKIFTYYYLGLEI